jgi:hypothetical protein
MRPSEALTEAIRSRAFPERASEDGAAVARAVAESGGESVLGIVFFGSRKTNARPDRWSGYDLFVLTRDYPEFYRSLKAARAMKRGPMLVAALNSILPPNQISLRLGGGEDGPLAKCSVVTLSTLVRETSERRKDHFCAGRLFQPTEVLFTRNRQVADEVLGALASAHAVTFSWVRPWLPPVFGVETYCRSLLRVSLGREIRPEPATRSDALWEAQRGYLTETYSVLLQDLVDKGDLEPRGSAQYALARPVSVAERLRVELYFRRSKVRATARWFKYMVTFDDWLEYIVRKVQRHSGQEIVLGRWERALPIVFLWPRLVRYLRGRNR